ncbi:serine threonine kinase [Fusarium beomiforme]|uniref:Serine threonine kinase n=1 Tax=Fusarium beomiforme TaxID=44412 RepID=A0A9P5AET4_9HYPO|nr:serine threonine kinase [Fusarium beomiforme]
MHDARISPISQDGRIPNKDHGVHMDIKPSNILYFSQETDKSPFGTLKLADCGLMKFHSLASRTRKSLESSYAGSRTYRAPEYDIDHIISKKVDIWAIGCAFSEFLTWAILPCGSADEYRLTRTQESSLAGSKDECKKNFESGFFQHYLHYEFTDQCYYPIKRQRKTDQRTMSHTNTSKNTKETKKFGISILTGSKIPRLKTSVSQVRSQAITS